jgi:hypothetical protein
VAELREDKEEDEENRLFLRFQRHLWPPRQVVVGDGGSGEEASCSLLVAGHCLVLGPMCRREGEQGGDRQQKREATFRV